MKILVVGGGGREHAIIWKLSQSRHKPELFCAPGNGGIASVAKCLPYMASDIEGIVKFACDNDIDLTVVAPDDPLAAGMVNALEAAGKRAFGPVKEAAIIEASKSFSKDLMKKYNIPTADYRVFTSADDALAYLDGVSAPIVVKADGLALGKGVIIAETIYQAKEAVINIMQDKVFGSAGTKVVIEEFISGPEISLLCFTDGKTIVPMVSSQDHKRALDGDKGLNTGGMGAFSPSRHMTDSLLEKITADILQPTVDAMNNEGRTFKGVLYFGLMLTKDGVKVLEYNARFGDPETQVVLPRLDADLVDIFNAVIDGRLDQVDIKWRADSCACVVLASGGYPAVYKKGLPITGVQEAEAAGALVFHAGTSLSNGVLVTSGGRVLGVTCLGSDVSDAAAKAYSAAACITFENLHMRHDIGKK